MIPKARLFQTLIFLIALQDGISLAQTRNATATAAADTYDTDPAVDPARPTVTNPAHIPPPGYLQFEQGVLQAQNTPDGPNHQFSAVQSTKLSLDHHLMIFAQDQLFARSVTAGSASNDTGDLDLGLQIVFLDEGEGRSRMPSVAVSYVNRIRSGTSANLDVGGYNRSLLLLASGNFLGLHYDTNLIVNEQPGDTPNLTGNQPPRRAQWGQTLSVTHDFNEKISLSGEVWRFSQPLTGGNAVAILYALTYQPRKTIIYDAGFSRGLTSTSTTWQTFVGISYLLPHRLWPLLKTPHS